MRHRASVILLLFLVQLMVFGSGAKAAGRSHVVAMHFVADQSGQATASSSPSTASSPAVAPTPTREKEVTAYTLPPELYRKARDLGRFRFRFALIDFFYGVFVLWVILRWKYGPKFRDWAESAARNRFMQAAIFAPLLILTMDILGLPSDIYQNSVDRKYGLSVQSWGSWFWDWTKAQFIAVVLGIVLVSILYAVIRSSPRRWWFYFWLVSLPIGWSWCFCSR